MREGHRKVALREIIAVRCSIEVLARAQRDKITLSKVSLSAFDFPRQERQSIRQRPHPRRPARSRSELEEH